MEAAKVGKRGAIVVPARRRARPWPPSAHTDRVRMLAMFGAINLRQTKGTIALAFFNFWCRRLASTKLIRFGLRTKNLADLQRRVQSNKQLRGMIKGGEKTPEAIFPGTKLTPHAYLRLSSEQVCTQRQEE